MLRFAEFEALGLAIAGITEAKDGDFARPGGRPEGEALSLAQVSQRPVATVRQVHGTRVHLVEPATLDILAGVEADGLITRAANLAIAVRVADCVPVFLFDPAHRAAGIVHAGRRGTFDGVAAAAIRAMRDRFGTVPSAVHALIGPSAGPCCYEVDEASATEFRAKGYPVSGRNLDLWQGNKIQLEDEGLRSDNIVICGDCTICTERFHSYRATGTPARNLAILAL